MPILDGWYTSGQMDTHRLKYFLRIAEEGSITRARPACWVSPSPP